MKRLIFIVIVFLLAFSFAEAQTLKKNTASQYGKYTWYQYPGDTVAAQIIHIINSYLAVSQYGTWYVKVDSSALPLGAATSANQVIQIAKADSTVDMVTQIKTILDSDSLTVVDIINIKNLLTQIESEVDGLEVQGDTSNARLEEIKLDAEAIKTILDSDSLTVKDIATVKQKLTLIETYNSRLLSSAQTVAPGAPLATTSFAVGGQYNATPPTFTDTQQGQLQVNSAGDLKITLDSESVTVGAITGNGTFSAGALAVTTAAPLAANQACKKVVVTNYTAGEYVYVGASGVATGTGFPLGYLDSITLTVKNLNLVYVVSDGTSCDIRYSYEN